MKHMFFIHQLLFDSNPEVRIQEASGFRPVGQTKPTTKGSNMFKQMEIVFLPSLTESGSFMETSKYFECQISDWPLDGTPGDGHALILLPDAHESLTFSVPHESWGATKHVPPKRATRRKRPSRFARHPASEVKARIGGW